ncbi:hypothetical protein BX265_4959 [Streptomyces sp. TLI_235]|nr:hypothetical protein [Streptomyces sp. TLI_235]PBC80123.1 hypothetical protein BX265_4959 [Streptomyces sp. TLI_235]
MTAPRTAHVQLGGSVGLGKGTVSVDGVELRGVRSVSVEGAVGVIPRLVVEVVLHEAVVDGELLITVPPKTAATLAALGWTPPPDQPLDGPGQRHAWEHSCGTLNAGSPDSGCCAGCRMEPHPDDQEHIPRFVLVQVGGDADAAAG